MSLWDPRNVPPYPPARFTKDEPEISASLRRGTDTPDYVTPGKTEYHYLANQKATVSIASSCRPPRADLARTFTARCQRRSSSCRER